MGWLLPGQHAAQGFLNSFERAQARINRRSSDLKRVSVLMEGKDLLDFGPFRLDVAKRIVLRDGQVVPLPGKAFDVLLVLLRRAGEVVTKDELMKAVWPDTFVEEGNLTQTVFVLRKAVGESLILTVPRLGYRFSGEVTPVTLSQASLPPPKPLFRRALLPWLVSGVAGLTVGAAIWLTSRPSPSPSSPLMRLRVEMGAAELDSRSTVALSPDGTRIVFAIRAADGGDELATQTLDLAAITAIPGTGGGHNPFFSPDGQWVAYAAHGKLKKISIHGGQPATICCEFGLDGDTGGSWSENNQLIVPRFGLYRTDARGGVASLITRAADHAALTLSWPQFLPGGDAVLYTASDRLTNFEDARIEVLSLKTGRCKTLVERGYYGRYLPSHHLVWVRDRTLFAARFDPARLEIQGRIVPVIEGEIGNAVVGNGQFDFSRTGAFVYLSGDFPKWQLIRVYPDGRKEPLTTNPDDYRDPAVSPDGKQVALAVGRSHSDIYVYDLERRSLNRRSFTSESTREPAWSSDGRHIAFKSTAPNAGAIWWTRTDGVGEPQLIYQAKSNVDRFALSPDDRKVIVAPIGPDVWLLPMDTGDPDHPKAGSAELFLRRTRPGITVAFSPDSQWIAYSSHEPGDTGIYVRPADTRRSGKIQLSAGKDDCFPVWSRSGHQLLYQDAEGHIRVIDYVAKGDSFSGGAPRLWMDQPIAAGNRRRFFDLGRDGKHIVTFVHPEDRSGEQRHVTFLVNFFDELRRRLPDRGQ